MLRSSSVSSRGDSPRDDARSTHVRTPPLDGSKRLDRAGRVGHGCEDESEGPSCAKKSAQCAQVLCRCLVSRPSFDFAFSYRRYQPRRVRLCDGRRGLRAKRLLALRDEGFHLACDRLHYRGNDCVSELTVGLCIRDRNPPAPLTGIKTHQSCALARSESTWISAAPTDENLGPVLVVARAQRSRNVFRSNPTESKAVSHCPMLLGIVAQIAPEVIGQDIFRSNPAARVSIGFLRLWVAGEWVENRFESRPRLRRRRCEARQVETAFSLETHNKDAFAMLRNVRPSIDDAMAHAVAELVSQHSHDRGKSLATIMALKVLHVLQYERCGFLRAENLLYFKGERPSGRAIETVWPSERVLLRYASKTERLARKSRE